MHGHHGFGHGGTHYGGHHHHNDIGDGLTLVGDLLGLNVYPKNCPHRNDGFGFGHQSAHNSGAHGGHAFRRHCDPPRYGYHGYYYNYPGLVIGTAIIGTAALTSTMQPRHVVYVSQKQQVPNLNSNVNVRHYYVIVPENIYPGETFRAVLGNEEVLITCPEISGPGEKIMVTTEQPPMEPIVVNGVPVTVDVNKPVQAVEIINSGYTHENIHYPSTIYMNNNSNNSVPSAPPAIVIPSLPTNNDNNSNYNSSISGNINNGNNNSGNNNESNGNNNGGANSSFGPYFTTGNNKNSNNNNQNIYNTYPPAPPAVTPAPFNPAYVGDATQPSANNSNNSGNNNTNTVSGGSGNSNSNSNSNNNTNTNSNTNSNNTSVINGNVVYSACGTYIPNNNTTANTNLTINNSNNINNNTNSYNSNIGSGGSPRTPNIFAGITSPHLSANISAIPAPSVSAVARNGMMTGTATAAVLSAVGSGGGKSTGGNNLTGDVTSCPKCTFYNPSFATVCKGCNAPINN